MPVDLDRLRAALIEWERQWRRLGLAVVEQALPGATEAELRQAEERTELRLPAEVRTWFAWHNGTGGTSGGVAAPGWYLVSVADAAELYLGRRAALPPEEVLGLDPDRFWPPSYFPLARSGGSGVLVVDCSGPSDEPAPIDVVNPHAELPDWPLSPILPSVAALVEIFAETLRDGWASISNGDNRTLSLSFMDLPDHLRVDVW